MNFLSKISCFLPFGITFENQVNQLGKVLASLYFLNHIIKNFTPFRMNYFSLEYIEYR